MSLKPDFYGVELALLLMQMGIVGIHSFSSRTTLYQPCAFEQMEVSRGAIRGISANHSKN